MVEGIRLTTFFSILLILLPLLVPLERWFLRSRAGSHLLTGVPPILLALLAVRFGQLQPVSIAHYGLLGAALLLLLLMARATCRGEEGGEGPAFVMVAGLFLCLQTGDPLLWLCGVQIVGLGVIVQSVNSAGYEGALRSAAVLIIGLILVIPGWALLSWFHNQQFGYGHPDLMALAQISLTLDEQVGIFGSLLLALLALCGIRPFHLWHAVPKRGPLSLLMYPFLYLFAGDFLWRILGPGLPAALTWWAPAGIIGGLVLMFFALLSMIADQEGSACLPALYQFLIGSLLVVFFMIDEPVAGTLYVFSTGGLLGMMAILTGIGRSGVLRVVVGTALCAAPGFYGFELTRHQGADPLRVAWLVLNGLMLLLLLSRDQPVGNRTGADDRRPGMLLWFGLLSFVVAPWLVGVV